MPCDAALVTILVFDLEHAVAVPNLGVTILDTLLVSCL